MIAAQQVWDILVEACGAYPEMPGDFIYWWEKDDPISDTEYRFQGRLGFGGKFWRYRGRHFVTCYTEDETEERLAMIESADAKLELLKLWENN